MSITERVAEALSGLTGHTGVYSRALEGGDAIELHADTPFTLASVVKLPMLIHTLRKVQQGELDLDTRIEQGEADRLPGSGVIVHFRPGLNPTLHDLLYLMMIVSDNQATDAVLGTSSKEAVQADMHALGYTDFHMPHSVREVLYSLVPNLPLDASFDEVMAEFQSPGYERRDDAAGGSAEIGNRCTPRTIAAMLTDLEAGKLLDEEHTRLALDILIACQTNSRIPQGVPFGTRVAHKTGTFNSRTNDAGIVFGPETAYSLVIFNHGEPDERKASRAFADVSELLYGHYS